MLVQRIRKQAYTQLLTLPSDVEVQRRPLSKGPRSLSLLAAEIVNLGRLKGL